MKCFRMSTIPCPARRMGLSLACCCLLVIGSMALPSLDRPGAALDAHAIQKRQTAEEPELTDVDSTQIELIRTSLGPREVVDLVLVLDRSKGTNKDTFYRQTKKLARAVLTQYATIHPDYARLAVITFAKDVTLVLDGIRELNATSAFTKCSLFSKGNDCPWEREVFFTQNLTTISDTNIKDSFTLTAQILEEGKRRRAGAKGVILLMSDGSYEDFNDPKQEAQDLKLRLNATIFGVGVGNWLKIGNVRDLTTEINNEKLYGSFKAWERMLRNEEWRANWTYTSYSSDDEPLWIPEDNSSCGDSCRGNSSCFCDVHRGVEECRCDPGFYLDGNTCTLCPEDTFKNHSGNGACLPCPYGTSTVDSGATSVDQCRCDNDTCTDPCGPASCPGLHMRCVAIDSTTMRCECEDGWEGNNCNTNVDDCVNNRCHGDARCQDGVNGYTCTCVTWGLAGGYCDLNIDECAHDVCANDAMCIDRMNDYNCNCTDDWEGRFCQDFVDPTPPSTPAPTDATTPSPTPQVTPAPQDDTMQWIIIGCVAGGLLLFIIILAAALVTWRKRKDQQTTEEHEVKTLAREFDGFWKRKTVRGTAWMDEDSKGGLPSAPVRHRPDLLTTIATMQEEFKTDEYATLSNQSITLDTGMEGWQNYIYELEDNKAVEMALIVKLSFDKMARSQCWMFEESEMVNLEGLLEERECDVPIRVQGGEYHVFSNDGIIAAGRTIGSDQISRVIAIGKTKTYLIVAVAMAETDEGKCQREVQWMIDHISSEGY